MTRKSKAAISLTTQGTQSLRMIVKDWLHGLENPKQVKSTCQFKYLNSMSKETKLNKVKAKPKQMTISLSEGEVMTDWLRDQLISFIDKRYKLGFMAMDMDVGYHQLWRFMKGEKMSESFLNKAFNFVISLRGDILE
jgi:hypothetical protein